MKAAEYRCWLCGAEITGYEVSLEIPDLPFMAATEIRTNRPCGHEAGIRVILNPPRVEQATANPGELR